MYRLIMPPGGRGTSSAGFAMDWKSDFFGDLFPSSSQDDSLWMTSLTFSSAPTPGGTPDASYPAPIVWQGTIWRSNPVLSAISRENSLILRSQMWHAGHPNIALSHPLCQYDCSRQHLDIRTLQAVGRSGSALIVVPSRIHTRWQRPFSLYHTLPEGGQRRTHGFSTWTQLDGSGSASSLLVGTIISTNSTLIWLGRKAPSKSRE